MEGVGLLVVEWSGLRSKREIIERSLTGLSGCESGALESGSGESGLRFKRVESGCEEIGLCFERIESGRGELDLYFS